jgi:ABC-type multidrug transport system permease subunit
VAYNGPVQELPVHFDKLGFPCKANFNPADHVMFLMQKEPAETIRRIKDVWNGSDMASAVRAKVDALQGAKQGHEAVAAAVVGSQTGFCVQLAALLKREARGTMRNKGILFARYGMTVFLAIMYAWLFAGTGRKGDSHDSEGTCLNDNFNFQNCQIDFQGHLGSLLSLAIATMMGAAQPVMLTFPQERPVFLREYAARQYGVVPYFVSKTLVEMPVILVAAALQFLVSYWLMGLKGNFLWLVVVSWLLAITSSALALIVGCGVASVEKAIQFGPLVLLPQMLFSGLFVPINSIPTSLRWVQYICPLKYAINVLGVVEFWYVKKELDSPICQDAQANCPGFQLRKGLLESQSIYFDQWERNLGLLIALYFAFRVFACTLLWRKGRYVF